MCLNINRSLQVSSISSKLSAALHVGESNIWKPPATVTKKPTVPPALPKPSAPYIADEPSSPSEAPPSRLIPDVKGPQPVGLPKQPGKLDDTGLTPFQSTPLGVGRPLQPAGSNPPFLVKQKALAPLEATEKPRQPQGAHMPLSKSSRDPETSPPAADDVDDETGSVEGAPMDDNDYDDGIE